MLIPHGRLDHFHGVAKPSGPDHADGPACAAMVAAVAVEPKIGARSSVSVTPAAAGVSQATPTQAGPGKARPASRVTVREVASTAAVRSRRVREAESGVTVTNSWHGSAPLLIRPPRRRPGQGAPRSGTE